MDISEDTRDRFFNDIYKIQRMTDSESVVEYCNDCDDIRERSQLAGIYAFLAQEESDYDHNEEDWEAQIGFLLEDGLKEIDYDIAIQSATLARELWDLI